MPQIFTTRGLSALALALGTTSGAANAADAPVALIIAQGGLGDQSYNDLAFSGFKRGLAETKLDGKPVESKDVVAQAEDMLRRAADAGFGLIVDLEYSHGETLAKVAAAYPDAKFVILNQTQPGKNVASVLFQEQEGSYLAGALAAMVTTDTSIKGINDKPIIGVIGGTKSVGIDKFIVGYIQGARDVNPKIDVKVAYSNNFGDPAVGLQMAKAMFEEGLAQGNVLTSMVKRTDVAVETVVKDYASGKFPGGGTVTLGLREDGVGLSEMKYTKAIIPAADLKKV